MNVRSKFDIQFLSDRDRPPVTVKARYQKTRVVRFDGNPFIEALPPIEPDRNALLAKLENYPPEPTRATRNSPEMVRLMELSTIGDVVYPFPSYAKAALAITTMIRESYVARNPVTAIDMQRRHAIAAGDDGVPFPANWKSSAKGYGIFGITGMGKTTFLDALLLHYPEAIEHTSYHGKSLVALQVVYIVLRIPHDATLKSLCIGFLVEIDRITGSKYAQLARSISNIAPMVELMRTVATAVSLSLMAIDELQNLGAARGANAEFTLNLFGTIIERLGISLLVLATPAIDKVLLLNVRNARKTITTGSTHLTPMVKNSAEWRDFCEVHWQYTYTKNKARLNKDTLSAWYDASAGDTGFAVAAFQIAQRNAIGGVELVDADGFRRVTGTDMAILQPALNALLTNDAARLANFEDLIFRDVKVKALLDSIGEFPLGADTDTTIEEFDDLQPDRPVPPKKRSGKPRKSKPRNPPDTFPVENPLTS
ncbi:MULTISPECIES: ATP-binding protein [Paraburkholderia]|uniref:ATP-binding protein n=1 Tax=Paraburkholderia podalyriae TaxID=1938811 RepID=A0ABR7PVP2_9BURK|nr:ATP-binding protein [Paraburkholderia podalyriae]MBC8750289.1 ATP-binding protein [Paraburkholderia podalyriae]